MPLPSVQIDEVAALDVYSLSPADWGALLDTLGHSKAFDSVWKAVYRDLVGSFDSAVRLPEPLRRQLAEAFPSPGLEPVTISDSVDGLTRKALLRLKDGRRIETVRMQFYPDSARSRGTVCVSTQVGCAVGCPFCATGAMGFSRNLTVGEIVGQVVHFARQSPIKNVVFMGMGEPMLNYGNVTRAIETMVSPLGLGLPARRITLSTSGIPPAIRRLSAFPHRVNLAVSLHAPNDELRDILVPINRKYPLAKLLEACDAYSAATKRRILFEYVLLAGVNDSETLASELGALMAGRSAHVNLIPVNSTTAGYVRPSTERVRAFQSIVRGLGVPATVRLEKGGEIDAACGQLATSRRPS